MKAIRRGRGSNKLPPLEGRGEKYVHDKKSHNRSLPPSFRPWSVRRRHAILRLHRIDLKSSKRVLSSGDYFYFCNRKNELVGGRIHILWIDYDPKSILKFLVFWDTKRQTLVTFGTVQVPAPYEPLQIL